MADTNDLKTRIGELLVVAFEGEILGSFAGHGPLPVLLDPGLSIENFGKVNLPLTPSDAERIMAHAEQAPYGKRKKTIVNRAVRDTRQIDAKSIKVENSNWDNYLNETILPAVGDKLGIIPQNFDEAHMYKLLLYGKDGHFAAHQDTEKERGMFGTLVIILPSSFTGGQTTVTHCSQEMKFNPAEFSASGASYICLYTDVHHTVHSVTSGYRLALTYNLVMKPNLVSSPLQISPNERMLQLRDLFKEWLQRDSEKKSAPTYLAHVLSHQYSKVGLGFANIKGEDKVKIEYLKLIAEEFGFSIYHAQLDVRVMGVGEGDSEDDYVYDLIHENEREYKVKNAINPQGHEINLNKLELDEKRLSPSYDILKDWEIDKKETESYTGNDGGDIDQYYYRSMILMWPRSRQDIMLRAGAEASGHGVVRRLEECLVLCEGMEEIPDTIATEYEKEFIILLNYLQESEHYQYHNNGVDNLARPGLILRNRALFSLAAASTSSHAISTETWIAAVKLFEFRNLRETMDSVFKAVSLVSDQDDMKRSDKKTKNLCNILAQMLIVFSEDREFLAWGRSHLLYLLSNFFVYDNDNIKLIIDYEKNKKSEVDYQLLSLTLEKTDQVFRICHDYSRDSWETREKYRSYDSCDLLSETESLVKYLSSLALEGQDVAQWCQKELVRILSVRDKDIHYEDLRAIREYVALCIKQGNITYLTDTLTSLMKPDSEYTASYLSKTVKIFMQALRTELQKSSLSLAGPPFDSFLKYFSDVAHKTFQDVLPELPNDYTLRDEWNLRSPLKEFLASSIKHCITLRSDVRSWKSILTHIRGKLQLEVTSPDLETLIVRKTSSVARADSDWETIFSEEEKENWRGFKCDNRYCEDCRKIKAFLAYQSLQRQKGDFFKVLATEDSEGRDKKVQSQDVEMTSDESDVESHAEDVEMTTEDEEDDD